MSSPIINPNPYDDERFMEVANALQDELTELLDSFWEAGASISDIESEIAEALDASDVGPDNVTYRVSIEAVEE